MPGHVDASFSHYCGLCSAQVPSKDALDKHMASHQETNARPLPCPGCSFMFPTLGELENHKNISGHSDTIYKCEKCGEIFKTPVGLKRHTKVSSSCYAGSSHIQARAETTVSRPSYAVGRAPRTPRVDFDMPVSAMVQAGIILPYQNDLGLPTQAPVTSHALGFHCKECNQSYRSEALYNRHFLACMSRNRHLTNIDSSTDVKLPSPVVDLEHTGAIPRDEQETASQSAMLVPYHVTGCQKSFRFPDALDQHQKVVHHSDRNELGQKHKPTNVFWCGIGGCNSEFQSQAALNQHRKASHIGMCDAQGCGKPFMSAGELADHKQQTYARQSHLTMPSPDASAPDAPVPASSALVQASVRPPADPVHLCGIQGCSKTFRSEAGLKQHKADSHGVGGKGLDIHGKDSWMLSQASRNQLRESGVRSEGITPQASRGPRHAPLPAMNVARHFQASSATLPPARNPKAVPAVPATASLDRTIGGPDEIAQAIDLDGKIKRMMITADIAIQHDGKIVYDGTAWIRIGVGRQQEAAAMLDELVHLRKLNRQGQAKQHVSHPTTFEKDFPGDYPSSEFEQLPEPRSGSLSAVVLRCSKVLLDNQCEDVVRIAAVDLLTGRPLLSYLVYTEGSQEKIQDWRPAVTGLSSFQDFEHAVVQKFKILKGWMAARAALGRFVDQNTILVGYNLRSDLDALRIRHGRCADLVKMFEKAAEHRPLSKKQLSLETVLRDIADAPNLRKDRFGRDCLQDAFGIREVVLYSIKSKDKFVSYAKKKATEYLRSGGL